MIMNSLMKRKILPLILFFTLSVFAPLKSQIVVYQDDNHVIYYEVLEDSIRITAEDLKDFTLDLSIGSGSTLDSSTIDFILLMFDVNQNGTIDPPAGTDVYYAYDKSNSKKVCKGELLSNSSISTCGSLSSAASMKASLLSTTSNLTKHVVYQIDIPTPELSNNKQVCARISLAMHRAGDSKYLTSNFPASAVTYSVKNYFPLTLYKPVNLGNDVNFCPGNTISATHEYPSYSWSDNSTSSQMTPKEDGMVHLTVKDNTCALSDTVGVVIQDENYCSNLDLQFPNVVTANNDGINDFFEALPSIAKTSNDYSQAELSVFNRWGVKVGGNKAQAPVWDCHLDWGRKAPPGTYFYVYNPGSPESAAINGYFTLIYPQK